MKKLILITLTLTLIACGQSASNPCPKPERSGLYENQKYYECLEEQFARMSRG